MFLILPFTCKTHRAIKDKLVGATSTKTKHHHSYIIWKPYSRATYSYDVSTNKPCYAWFFLQKIFKRGTATSSSLILQGKLIWEQNKQHIQNQRQKLHKFSYFFGKKIFMRKNRPEGDHSETLKKALRGTTGQFFAWKFFPEKITELM